MSVLPACMTVQHMHVIPTEVKKGHWIPWVWHYRLLWTALWVPGIKPGSSGRVFSDFKCWVISLDLIFILSYVIELLFYHLFLFILFLYIVCIFVSVCGYVYMLVPREIRVLRFSRSWSYRQLWAVQLRQHSQCNTVKMQAVDYMNMFSGSP